MALSVSHNELSIQTFTSLYSSRQLNLAPAFQRQSVWSVRDRRKLIESVLTGMPLPTVYLFRNTSGRGKIRFDVIDGKQRIETLLQFMGKGPLKAEYLWLKVALPDEPETSEYDWWGLPKKVRNEYLTTKIHTIEVEGDLADIIQLFVRINSTGARLTQAERRNAQYLAEPSLKAAQKLADDLGSWLKRNGILTDGQIRRSRHVELVCELMLSLHAGTPLNGKSRIDKLIGGGGLDPADVAEAAHNVRRAIKNVGTMLPDLKTTRFHQIADFYTLTVLIHRLWSDGLAVSAHAGSRNELAGELLREFGRGVDEVTLLQRRMKPVPATHEPHREYLLTVREGTDSFPQRHRRERILREVLAGVFEELDTKRAFNKTQKRILWHAAKKKQCAECKTSLRWDEVHVDHVTAFIKGGRTNLSNARLLCGPCNRAKGPR